MKFSNPEPKITMRDIVDAEGILGFDFPPCVQSLYLLSNGGTPEPYVFENDMVDTVVTELLPLKSNIRGTALISYERLVLYKNIVPRHFFPFAIDGGGDYFFVDCSTLDGAVHFYRSDSAENERLLSLKLGFDQFWSSLKDEK